MIWLSPEDKQEILQRKVEAKKRKNMIEVTCLGCGIIFKVYNSVLWRKFCNKTCYKDYLLRRKYGLALNKEK